MCISKTLSPRLRTIIQVTLISILYVLARMVFFQAHSSKKKNRLATIWCPPIKSLSLFFVYIAKQIEHKRQKSKNSTRVALCHETAEKKTPHVPKMAQFLIGGKNGHCRGYSKAKWSPKTYRNYPLKSLELFYAQNCSKTHLILEKCLDVEKWQNWPFCKGHSKAKWVGTLKSEKYAKKDSKHITVILNENRL